MDRQSASVPIWVLLGCAGPSMPLACKRRALCVGTSTATHVARLASPLSALLRPPSRSSSGRWNGASHTYRAVPVGLLIAMARDRGVGAYLVRMRRLATRRYY